MGWNLFLDDERELIDVRWAPWEIQAKYRDEEWKIARNHQDVIKLVEEFGYPSFVSFDHDLGDFIPNGDGYQIAKYLVGLDIYTDYKMPEDFAFYVHSLNPIGAENIQRYIDNYLKVK